MIERLRESRSWQLVFVGALIIILPLIVDINNRLDIIRQMKQEESQLNQELQRLQAENQALQTQLEFVQSPKYTELWARTQARMTLPGEVAIVPLMDGKPVDVSTHTTEDEVWASPRLSPTQAWHDLFFGPSE